MQLGLWDLSSPTRHRTWALSRESRESSNHWTTREFPVSSTLDSSTTTASSPLVPTARISYTHAHTHLRGFLWLLGRRQNQSLRPCRGTPPCCPSLRPLWPLWPPFWSPSSLCFPPSWNLSTRSSLYLECPPLSPLCLLTCLLDFLVNHCPLRDALSRPSVKHHPQGRMCSQLPALRLSLLLT